VGSATPAAPEYKVLKQGLQQLAIEENPSEEARHSSAIHSSG